MLFGAYFAGCCGRILIVGVAAAFSLQAAAILVSHDDNSPLAVDAAFNSTVALYESAPANGFAVEPMVTFGAAASGENAMLGGVLQNSGQCWAGAPCDQPAAAPRQDTATESDSSTETDGSAGQPGSTAASSDGSNASGPTIYADDIVFIASGGYLPVTAWSNPGGASTQQPDPSFDWIPTSLNSSQTVTPGGGVSNQDKATLPAPGITAPAPSSLPVPAPFSYWVPTVSVVAPFTLSNTNFGATNAGNGSSSSLPSQFVAVQAAGSDPAPEPAATVLVMAGLAGMTLRWRKSRN